MKVGVASELSTALLQKAKAKGIETLVFCRIKSDIDRQLLASFAIHDTSKLSEEGKNFAFSKVETQLTTIEASFPKLLSYRNYALKAALQKDIYWSLIVNYLNEQKCEELKAPGVSFIQLDAPKDKLAQFLKFCLRLIRPRTSMQLNAAIDQVKGKIAVRINSISALPFFGKLLSSLHNENLVCFQTESLNHHFDTANKLKNNGYPCLLFELQRKYEIGDKFSWLRLILRENIAFVNLLIDTQNKLKNSVDIFESLAINGAKGFLLNAGENEGEGVIAGWVAEKHRIKAFNFMNGTKAKDPINRFTTFQCWFMHDEQMQRMFLSYSNQPKAQLPVVGHLAKDLALEHVYSGTLDAWKEALASKKIIAFFSSIIYNKEREDVGNMLLKVLANQPDVWILIRKHPSETGDFKIAHERCIVLPDFKEKSGLALYDLLQHASLAISFGSTVSLQASWFNIPSATFEYRDASLLLYVDQLKVHHFNSVTALEQFVLAALKNSSKVTTFQKGEESVAHKMCDIILADA